AHPLDAGGVFVLTDPEGHVLSFPDAPHGRISEAMRCGSAGSSPSGIEVPWLVKENGLALRIASSTALPMWLVASRCVGTKRDTPSGPNSATSAGAAGGDAPA